MGHVGDLKPRHHKSVLIPAHGEDIAIADEVDPDVVIVGDCTTSVVVVVVDRHGALSSRPAANRVRGSSIGCMR